MASGDMFYINGIDATTGDYLVPPMSAHDAAAIAMGNPPDLDLARWLGRLWRVSSQPNLGLPMDVEATDVPRAGWGIVFHASETQQVRAALEPLIALRRQQVDPDRFKILDYRPDEGRAQWLARHDVSSGTVEPRRVPFYLLLVGGPEKIPFPFGHLLSVEYAVGRVSFESAQGYARYAQSVVAYENGVTVPNKKRAVFFAPRHDFDPATQMSADLLVKPLVEGVTAGGDRLAEPGVAEHHGFESRMIWGQAATKAALTAELSGDSPPAFLFTASHGLGFPLNHPDQRTKQGALICQDWPGFGEIGSDHYFAAADLPAAARVAGLISFHFACYSAWHTVSRSLPPPQEHATPADRGAAILRRFAQGAHDAARGRYTGQRGPHRTSLGIFDPRAAGHAPAPALPQRHRADPLGPAGRLRDEGLL